jgi:4-hydroxysphinganine ceramide fatty acyl 2-hydroxylase
MNTNVVNNKGKARLFENKWLEFFTKSHPIVIWVMYISIIFLLLNSTDAINEIGVARSVGTALAGLICWTLFEYIIHRFAFHFNPKGKLSAKIIYIIHGNHHHFPRDKERLFMPPVPSLIIALLFFSIMYLVSYWLGVDRFLFTFFSGFIIGYLMYGTMHYAIHAGRPPFKWMKPLWRNHHLHHYKEGQKGFGVSTTLWDRLFGTMYDDKIC